MRTDVFVIGSGQAGVPLSVRLAEAGKRVLLAEAKDLGGTCVNNGCTPTKTMIASARAAHLARRAPRLGVQTGEVAVRLGDIVDRKERVVRQWRASVQHRIDGAADGLTLLHGRARFVGPREIEVGGERYAADVVIVNVGCRPAIPPIRGLDTVPWFDNGGAMELREVPAHLIILGGGYIGCEFAQMFRRFGSQVTVVEAHERLLRREDPETSAALGSVFESEGIRVEVGAAAKSVSLRAGQITVDLGGSKELSGSHLLVAVGRRPNTDDLGSDAAGIALDKRGFITVDDQYHTSVEGVYAVGDVTPGPHFTHAAWDDHRLLFDILRGRGSRGRGDRLIPTTAFTDPQVAHVGLTEQEAKAKGLVYEAATMPFGNIARAIELDETAGTMKVLIDPMTERILGAAIVGSEAGELIHIFAVLMEAGATCQAIVDAEFVHPTFAEGLQSLVMKFKRYALA